MATASSIFADRFRKAIAAVGLGVRSSATQADASVPTITSGSGAPSADSPNGSLYMRTDGAADTTLYARISAAWAVYATTDVYADQLVNATIAVADVAGSNDTTLTLDLVRAADNTTALGSARQVLISAADTAYEPLGGAVGLDTGVTFSTATKGSIVDSGPGWALVTTDADGEFDCTVTNTGDVTTYFVASTASRGGSSKTLRCVVVNSNSDAATWSA